MLLPCPPKHELTCLHTAYCTVTLSPLLVFAAYIGVNDGNGKLDTATMFSSLVLIALLSSPLIHLFQALPTLGAAQGCFKRIHAFLTTPERLQGAMTGQNSPCSPNKDYEMHPFPREDGRVALSLRDASLGWSPGEPMLRGVNLRVKRGSVVAVVGKTGSGKSLLLRSIIGEAGYVTTGSVDVSMENVAFCSQTPWLENMSAEKTWTQYGSQDAKWLAQVLQACFLDDLTSLPDYRIGTIGSGGVRLSGGQRQRLVRCLPLNDREKANQLTFFSFIGAGESCSTSQRGRAAGRRIQCTGPYHETPSIDPASGASGTATEIRNHSPIHDSRS